MTTTYKILGQYSPGSSASYPGPWHIMYTVPSATQAIVRSIIVSANNYNTQGPLTVALLPSGVSTSTSVSTSSSIVSCSLPGGVSGTIPYGAANVYKYHVTMNAGDKIAVRTESSTPPYALTVTLSGVEIT
jgi:hypothetical protein